MKRLLPLLAIFIFSNCTHSPVVTHNVEDMAQPRATPVSETASSSPTPPETAKVEQPKQAEEPDRNEKFRNAPAHFNNLDFKNFSYPYKFYKGRKANVRLKDGKHEFDYKLEPDSDQGWINFSDALYVDLTKDGRKEAIVTLWHVSCGASCDGGAPVFYIYQVQRKGLKLLWQYETGSVAYGCGLKSFAVKHGEITLELFGKCDNKNRAADSVSGKFMVKDSTLRTFAFNGRKIVQIKKAFMDVPPRDVKNYEPESSIEE